MKRNLALLASAAMLAGIVAAQAQGTTPSPSGSSSTQCWDVSTKTIKNQAPGSMASGSTGSSSGTVGASPSGSAGSTAGSAGASSGSSSGSSPSGTSAASRPAGLRDC